MIDLGNTIHALGYRPEDDSWETDGRRTYIHDDDADRSQIAAVKSALLQLGGWYRDTSELRLFRHESGEVIELEPGGADCSGHYLHHMRAAVIA